MAYIVRGGGSGPERRARAAPGREAVTFSIIIPTHNEAATVGSQVAACLALRPGPEVIVSDGGSSDETASLAREAGARVVTSRRGRGLQMNVGAAVASGEVLVFLHVDVVMSQAAWSELNETMTDPGMIGGAFRRRFDSPSRVLAGGCHLADIRGSWLGVFLGDQAIFARRSIFQEAGGYPATLLFEDLEFSRRLRRQGRTSLIRKPVIASSRRFDREGNARRLMKNVMLIAGYYLGVDPDWLARRY